MAHPFLHESLTRLQAPLTPRRAVRRIRRYVRDNVLAGPEARGVLTTRKQVFGGARHELTARAKQIAGAQSPAVTAIHAAVVAEMVVAKVAATSEGRLLR